MGRIEEGKIAFLTSSSSRKARNLAADPRVAISVTDRDNPHVMAQVGGRVTTRIDGELAWDIIDRLSRTYTGQPYPLRTDRVVFLIEPGPRPRPGLRLTAAPASPRTALKERR